MFDFSKLVKNYLTKDIFYEMSLSRDKAEDEVTSLGYEFLKHLIKIQLYHHQKPESVDHWIDEIYAWMRQIFSIKLKQDNKRLKQEEIEKWLLDGKGLNYLNYNVYEKMIASEVISFLHCRYPYPNPDKEFNINKESYNEFICVFTKLCFFMSKNNHLDEIDFDEVYNCICSGFDIRL